MHWPEKPKGNPPVPYWPALLPPVGASLLAKNVNDNAGILNARGIRGFFASKLAPTF
jgi:hypothetical protein